MQVPGEVDSLEESSLCTVMKFDVTREEQEEKCDVTSDKSEIIKLLHSVSLNKKVGVGCFS
ncbi:uncharacterized protein LOC143237094 isoform X2 [Tachypleus tridentatus]|uniref:uncharacterized protein LOC143237094 isoform X2 n=1 Tax=Tachypleus tridentatus TaxID=6853 RepID=UPI003FD0A124